MQETRSNFFKLIKRNVTLGQAKIGKHECHKIRATYKQNTEAKLNFINQSLKKFWFETFN